MNDTIFNPASGAPAKHLVILLHGYGSNAQDLIGLAPEIAPALPDCAFVSPDAPFPCEMGFGRQWFGLSDRSPAAMKAGIEMAVPLLNAYIDEQKQRFGLEEADIALLGFSQGTYMSLSTAPSRVKTLAGVVGYSGALIPSDIPIVSRPPVLLVHGMADEVVPFAAMANAESTLRESGLAVETLARPGLGHGIDPQGLQAGIAFLHKIWG
jgi:phospholipase/carboxylesterase